MRCSRAGDQLIQYKYILGNSTRNHFYYIIIVSIAPVSILASIMFRLRRNLIFFLCVFLRIDGIGSQGRSPFYD